jgi:hypothetical protein
MTAGQTPDPWVLLVDSIRDLATTHARTLDGAHDGLHRAILALESAKEGSDKKVVALANVMVALTEALGIIKADAELRCQVERNREKHDEFVAVAREKREVIAADVRLLEKAIDGGKVGKTDMLWKGISAVFILVLTVTVTLAAKNCTVGTAAASSADSMDKPDTVASAAAGW